MSDNTPDTPDTSSNGDAPEPPAGGDATPGRVPEPTPDPTKRRPKDSEFFELPPDLKKLPPGGLPATVSSGTSKPKPDDKQDTAKKGCAGLLLLAGGAAAAAASALFALVS
ncbi:MAG: hypothetical protein ACYTGX_10470 [Planctomycetota bacterium]